MSGLAQMTPLEEALQQPELPVGTDQNQIVVGVLVKYVNFGKGWRHRLFVLKGGVLRYYKVFGPSRVNVHALFESLRREGELRFIGAETSVIENNWKRGMMQPPLLTTMSSFKGAPKEAILPTSEIHLQVTTIQESEADYRKFYVISGNLKLHLRAETREDRQAWVDALRAAKGVFEAYGSSPQVAAALANRGNSNASIASGDNAFLELLEEVRGRLAEKGASGAVQEYVQDVLTQQHQRYHHFMAVESDKRRALLDHIRKLQNEKRELETVVVVGARLQNNGGPNGTMQRTDSQADEQSETSQGPGSDDEADDDGSHSRRGIDEEEVFYDCDPTSPSYSGGGSAAGSQGELAPSLSNGAPLAGQASSAAAAPKPGAIPDPAWVAAEGPAPPRRERLPAPAQMEKSVSLWSIIKECVGKDLTRICLPVYFNEPISALQRFAEDLEYTELLDTAAQLPAGSVERLLRVAAFAVSGYSGTARASKPFNPLLGETYELVCQEKGFRMLAEKVVHHPTIIAGHSQGRAWELEADGEVRSKFWGRSIELHPVGVIHLTFADGEEFTWHKVTTSVNNIILGRMYVDHGGVMKVRSLAPGGLTAKLKFKEQTMLSHAASAHQVTGYIEGPSGKLSGLELEGKWDDAMYAKWGDGRSELLWRCNPPPPDPTRYNLTTFAIRMNEITPGLEKKLAPTDCRLRPDQHFLELGMYDQANIEKQRLETKQRAARKAAELGEPLNPRWFQPVPKAKLGSGDLPSYKYVGGYWEARDKGVFEGCRDIFGQ